MPPCLVNGKTTKRSKDIVKDRESDIKDADGAKLKGGGGIGQSLFFGTDPTLTWKKTLPWLAKHTKKSIILENPIPKLWKQFSLKNSKVTELAQKVKESGLMSFENALLCIVTVLSKTKKLPDAKRVLDFCKDEGS